MAKGTLSTKHHCPGKKTSPSNCRPAVKTKPPVPKKGEKKITTRSYCPVHQTYCKVCKEMYIFMKRTEPCPSCGYKDSAYKEDKA
ncbi:hypothetical protein IFR04_002716 [Cadophora malorum]|uniref:Uncharacterized protein n=1 Tax=Cadophora malorum TaxID=108018 RepID=A0A8H8BUA0_9HELO|nr:hypothetical protein IFR04_002716 [Cadophora malorum]